MTIQYDVQGSVGVITIASGKVNPMSPAMHRELHEVLVRFLADDQVHCGVLRGDGERAFCAGDDMKVETVELDSPEAQLRSELSPVHRLPGADESWEWAYENATMDRYKPIVGSVRGWCLGGGLALLLGLTDIRVAGDDAKFGLPEIAYGMGGAGGYMRLTRSIPYTAAMSLLLTGDTIDANEARRIHLVNEVVPAQDAFGRALAIAKKIASHPPLSVRLEMEATLHADDMTRRDAYRYGDRLYQLQRLAAGESESASFARARNKGTSES